MLQPPPEDFRVSRLKVAVIVLLIVVLFPFLLFMLASLRGARASAWRAQCLSNLKQLGLAMHMYAQDNNERFPTVGASRGEGGIASMKLLWGDYVSDMELFVCPGDKVIRWDGKEELSARHVSYGYDHAHSYTDSPDVAIMADYTGVEESDDGLPTCHYHAFARGMGGGWSVGGVFFALFVDGHVIASIGRDVGHDPGGGEKRDDIYTKSETLSPAEDSWITQ